MIKTKDNSNQIEPPRREEEWVEAKNYRPTHAFWAAKLPPQIAALMAPSPSTSCRRHVANAATSAVRETLADLLL
jgi:hypothetical protein